MAARGAKANTAQRFGRLKPPGEAVKMMNFAYFMGRLSLSTLPFPQTD
jgi:hypothetical protein